MTDCVDVGRPGSTAEFYEGVNILLARSTSSAVAIEELADLPSPAAGFFPIQLTSPCLVLRGVHVGEGR